MKKISISCVVLMLFFAESVLAQPTYQFAEVGTKHFITEATISVGDPISLDLWLTNAGSPQNAGGAWIDFTASTAKISYVSGGRCLAGGAEGCIGPGQDNAGLFLNEPLGPGTVLYQVLNLGGAALDGDGDLIVGTVTLECLVGGYAAVNLTTIPGVGTWEPIDDATVVFGSLLIHQVQTCTVGDDCDDGVACTDDFCDEVNNICLNIPNDTFCSDDGEFCNGVEYCDPVNNCSSYGNPCPVGTVCNESTDSCDLGDTDEDGVFDYEDNCPSTPNGPDGGTCRVGQIGESCLRDGGCGCVGVCSMNQEDTDGDGIGDACDN